MRSWKALNHQLKVETWTTWFEKCSFFSKTQ